MTHPARPAARRQAPPTQIVTGVAPEPRSRAQVARRFRRLLEEGAVLAPAGGARRDPSVLLTRRYLPRHELRLFDATYFLTDYRFDDSLGFLVGYVALGKDGRRVRRIHPRIFYKDLSLVWRVASHVVHEDDDYWIGKGDVRAERRADGEHVVSSEATTNLPYEVQNALDAISRGRRRQRDDDAVGLILRAGPAGRVEPYADFTRPRRRAAERYRIHGGRSVARFLRPGDPRSLRFARGFEPDFASGLLEESASASSFFGGEVRKLRFLSLNRRVQYLFVASPTHAWINAPQTLTTELSSFGVRTHDVVFDEDMSLPGYEYHDEDDSQIPAGYAGAPHPEDPDRSDASAWLEALPVIREFRATVLRRRPATRKGRAKA